MANVYVKSTGSNTSPYDTWAKAATAPLTATAFASAGDTIYMHGETFTISSDTTYSLAAGVRWICTNDSANEPPQTLSTAGIIDGTGTAGVDIIIGGSGTAVYIYGIKFRVGNGTNAGVITVSSVDNSSPTLDSCVLETAGTSSGNRIAFGDVANLINHNIKLNNTSVKFSTTSAYIRCASQLHWENSAILASGSTVPTNLFNDIQRGAGSGMDFIGCDFSGMTSGTVFSTTTWTSPVPITLRECKLGAATLNNTLTLAGFELTLYDCSTTDVHYQFAHYIYNGSTTISTSIYANDGAEYNIAGSKHSWIVAGNANTTRAYPYISPWFSKYNEGTSAITPSIEILRNDSATAFTDIEVWGEFAAKTTSGFPISTIYNNYGGHLATGANQTAGMGLSSWTGESGTAWSGKLVSPSMTPAEIGYISSRVLVAGNHVVYVDPTIRGT